MLARSEPENSGCGECGLVRTPVASDPFMLLLKAN